MSFFVNIFRKKKELLFQNFEIIGVDMHSHLIPGIDDGSKSIDDSLEMIRAFIDLGFRKLYITPHVMSDYYKNDPKIIYEGYNKLKEAIIENNLQIEIFPSAEYYVDFEFEEKLKSNAELLPISEKYILIEFSFYNTPENYLDVIFQLQTKGYKVIFAHPERFVIFQNDYEKYVELKNRDVFFQINSISLLGDYGLMAKKTAERLIHDGFVDFVGSDAHNINQLERLRALRNNKLFYSLITSKALLNNSL